MLIVLRTPIKIFGAFISVHVSQSMRLSCTPSVVLLLSFYSSFSVHFSEFFFFFFCNFKRGRDCLLTSTSLLFYTLNFGNGSELGSPANNVKVVWNTTFCYSTSISTYESLIRIKTVHRCQHTLECFANCLKLLMRSQWVHNYSCN